MKLGIWKRCSTGVPTQCSSMSTAPPPFPDVVSKEMLEEETTVRISLVQDDTRPEGLHNSGWEEYGAERMGRNTFHKRPLRKTKTYPTFLTRNHRILCPDPAQKGHASRRK